MSSAQSTAPEGLRQFPRAHGPLASPCLLSRLDPHSSLTTGTSGTLHALLPSVWFPPYISEFVLRCK